MKRDVAQKKGGEKVGQGKGVKRENGNALFLEQLLVLVSPAVRGAGVAESRIELRRCRLGPLGVLGVVVAVRLLIPAPNPLPNSTHLLNTSSLSSSIAPWPW